ncbi:MAG: hypothetical protein ACLP59_01905 [Bryobacteraceae bacterium]
MNFNPQFTRASFNFFNLRNVRVFWYVLIGVFLALASLHAVRGQDPPPSAQPPADQFFAGVVTTLTETSITVTRTVLGKSTVRTFAITPETVVTGGKLKMKSRVTVGWVKDENGDRALKIILRAPVPPPKKQ